jgi:hypothetical protein
MARKIDFKSTPLVVGVVQMSKRLKAVDSRFLQHPFKDLKASWYYGSRDSELIIFRDQDNELAKVLVNIHGLLFVWSRTVGVKTGQLRAEYSLQDTFRDSNCYSYDTHPNPVTLNLAALLFKLVTVSKGLNQVTTNFH